MNNPYLWLIAIILTIVVVGAAVSPLMTERSPGRHRAPRGHAPVPDDPEADELMRMGW